MKKRILAAALCAVTAISFTGCGKEETSAPANTNNSTVSTGTSTPTSTSTTSTSQTESSAPQSTSSATEESSAPEQPAANEDDFEWYGNDDGTVSITYYRGSDEKVIIPSTLGGKTVTQIQYYDVSPFGNNIDITSVIIPASVELISANSFSDCLNLSEVIFLGDIPDFTYKTFENTPWWEAKLAESTNGLIIIDNVLVYADPETTGGEVVIPDSVTQINSFAFYNCEQLTNMTIPDSVTKIGSYAFYGCDKLESIKLPAGITAINRNTFAKCSSLKSIDIPNGVTSIGNFAFEYCYEININLPDTVISLSEVAFGYYGRIGTVTFKGETYTGDDIYLLLPAAVEQNAIAQEFGGKDFIITDNVLEKVNPTATKIELPDSITAIADNAFEGCNSELIIVYNGKNYNTANIAKLKEAVNGN